MMKCGKVRQIHRINSEAFLAARCTGAAPTFFPAMGRFLDGGLAANNPTIDALVEIIGEVKEYNETPESEESGKESIKIVVSLGTGNQPVVKSRATDRIWPTNALEAYKSLTATVELAKMFVDTVCECDRWVVVSNQFSSIKLKAFLSSSVEHNRSATPLEQHIID